MGLKAPVTGSTGGGDRDAILSALSFLTRPGEIRELRAVPPPDSGRKVKWRIVSGDDLEGAADDAVWLSDEPVYWSLNPIIPGAKSASNTTVVRRVWFLVDVDAVRPKDVCSTEDEKAHASETAVSIADHLASLGWPDPVYVDSGNGYHLLYRIDLPNDALTQGILRQALEALGKLFDNEHARVDRAVHDAPRIARLPGTLNRKGPDTPDRPHRMASVRWSSGVHDPVSVEQLKALAKPPKGGKPLAPVTGGDGMERYVNSAIERECGRVAMAPAGERNNSLNRAAFSLAQMSSWPEMDSRQAIASLERVALGNGLAEHEVRQTIRSGWDSGVAEPRKRPEGKDDGKPKPLPPGTKLTIRASKVDPKDVQWLWQDRVAIGFISLFVGRTGVGKSFVLCDYVARVTTGRALEGDAVPRKPANVLMISEDPYDYVLTPRLMAMGADLDRVSFMNWEAMATYSLSNIEMLQQAYDEAEGPLLVAIDPPANFLGGKDEHKNSEVRQVLMKIVSWINEVGTACIMVTHTNKSVGKGVEALDRIMGSVAWASTGRVAMGLGPDPENPQRCVFVGIKSNLGPKAKALGYSIVPVDKIAKIEWHGEVDCDADGAFGGDTGKKSVKGSLDSFVEGQFREKRMWLAKDIEDLMRHAGFSFSAVRDYKNPNIRKDRVPDEKGVFAWFWEAKPGWPIDLSGSTGSTRIYPEISTQVIAPQGRTVDPGCPETGPGSSRIYPDLAGRSGSTSGVDPDGTRIYLNGSHPVGSNGLANGKGGVDPVDPVDPDNGHRAIVRAELEPPPWEESRKAINEAFKPF